MEEESETLNKSNDTCLNDSRESRSRIDTLQEPFLIFDENSELSFEDKSAIYDSLIDLVKAEYTFDNALQDRTAQFLKDIEPEWGDEDLADRLVLDIVPSSGESHSEFVESIVTLLSCPCSTIVAAALLFFNKIAEVSSFGIRCRIVESDLISNVLATIRPHTLSISGNEELIGHLIEIIDSCIDLTSPRSLNDQSITTAVDRYNHREMIFQQIVLPSSQFVSFLISNRNVLKGDLLDWFMFLLSIFFVLGPFHRSTLEFVLASPIAMALSSCLSFFEADLRLGTTLTNINRSLEEWTEEGQEVAQSGKRMMQALISDSFENSLELKMKLEKNLLLRLTQTGNECVKAGTDASQMTNRNRLSRKTTTHLCGLSSDVGNAVISGAYEQILGCLPIVQKCISETLFVYLIEMGCAPHSDQCTATHNLFEVCSAFFQMSGGMAYDHSVLSDIWVLEEIADPKTDIRRL
ncbi:hypothetical protein BLNAU_21628 [Blattamonas nauphoetae]|uniref:Uncharacterized protein n=1 Tax=Blattamonas nauphoetae TaxID=2049346 RepID=A0ABQ9WVD8_9EUKA|nr:hypothetical protein BLNAU_21628 [Blattamonas nauphoetae]